MQKEVYLVKYKDSVGTHLEKQYKIGHSKNVDSRMGQIVGSTLLKLEKIWSCKCTKYFEFEKWLHKRYSYKRIAKEWFEFEAYEIKNVIIQMEESKNNFGYIPEKEQTPIQTPVNAQLQNFTIYTCKYCNKTYFRQNKLENHITSVHLYDSLPINDKLIEEILSLKVSVDELKTKHEDNSTNTNNIKVINVNPYDKEDYSYIKKTFWDICAKKPLDCIPILIQQINFNIDHPENRNIVFKNKKEQTYYIADGGEGVIRKLAVVVDLFVCLQTHRIWLYVLQNIDKYDEVFQKELKQILDTIEAEVKKRKSYVNDISNNMVTKIKDILTNSREIDDINTVKYNYNYLSPDGKIETISN